MLNRLWVFFFVSAFIACMGQWLIAGDHKVFERVVAAIFSMSETTVEIAIGLVGAISFWLGMMKIAEQAGLIERLSRLLSPLFSRLMPEIPRGHPALASITMNLSANVLGLDNAATPMGLKAMKDLQSLNTEKDTATNSQILFLVLNTSSVTLFPIAVFVYRAQQGAADPTDVFIPILLATSASTFAGLLAVSIVQRIKLTDFVLLSWLGGFVAFMIAVIGYFSSLAAEALSEQSALLSNLLIFSFIVGCITIANRRKVDVYNAFIDGAKEGFQLCVSLIPYLLAMLTAIAVFRASGILGYIVDAVRYLMILVGSSTEFVEALPTALMKPFSGSGSRALMIDTMQTYGADSFPGRVASVVQGSTETTFYVLAVYFGAVGIKHSRHAIPCALIADITGIITAIVVSYWFFQ